MRWLLQWLSEQVLTIQCFLHASALVSERAIIYVGLHPIARTTGQCQLTQEVRALSIKLPCPRNAQASAQ